MTTGKQNFKKCTDELPVTRLPVSSLQRMDVDDVDVIGTISIVAPPNVGVVPISAKRLPGLSRRGRFGRL